jgi:two-component system, LytTR family, sensor histidine kinase LytS
MNQVTFTDNLQPIINLFLSLAEHFGLISAVAFILLSTRTLQRMISRELTVHDKLALILFFGAFGIFGTYDGDPIQGVIANLRAISMILAGLIGGPVVGIGAGLIAGGHRFLMDTDGFSSLPCALGTIIEGTAAGLVSMRLRNNALNWRVASLLAVIGESIHMGLILSMAHPFGTALAVVRLIGMPMILLNAIGSGCLIQMIRIVVRNRERRASIQARKAMTIADRTVVHLREGLNEASALATAKLIHDQTRVAAVAITDTRQLLAYVGTDEKLFLPGEPLRTSITSRVLSTGVAFFASDQTSVGEEVPHADFQSAIVVPLKKSGTVIGTLKFYGDASHPLNHTDFEIASGLADLFSTQLELEDIQVKAQLLAQAEIKWLKAKINPHFMFNALTTITFFCRTDKERARELLVNLSTYLRRNLEHGREFISLGEEMEQVAAYLSISNARSGDKIEYHMEYDRALKEWPIPPLIVQPLVENAVRHGLGSKEEGGRIWIHVESATNVLQIQVKDDGVGMSMEAVSEVHRKSTNETIDPIIGLRNINQRLEQIYGPAACLEIASAIDRGTAVTLTLPRLTKPMPALESLIREEDALV